jgi:hypothetical protein
VSNAIILEHTEANGKRRPENSLAGPGFWWHVIFFVVGHRQCSHIYKLCSWPPGYRNVYFVGLFFCHFCHFGILGIFCVLRHCFVIYRHLCWLKIFLYYGRLAEAVLFKHAFFTPPLWVLPAWVEIPNSWRVVCTANKPEKVEEGEVVTLSEFIRVRSITHA